MAGSRSTTKSDAPAPGSYETEAEAPEAEVQEHKDALKEEKSSDTKESRIDYGVGDKTFQVDPAEATVLNTIPTRATAVDALGTERVVLPSTDPWEPAQVEPDPVEVKRLAERVKVLEAKKEERLALLKGER